MSSSSLSTTESDEQSFYQIHELVFAEQLGVDLAEEFAADLVEIAVKALYVLPANWEMLFVEHEGNKIPYFYDSVQGNSQWTHPYMGDLVTLIQETREDYLIGGDEDAEGEEGSGDDDTAQDSIVDGVDKEGGIEEERSSIVDKVAKAEEDADRVEAGKPSDEIRKALILEEEKITELVREEWTVKEELTEEAKKESKREEEKIAEEVREEWKVKEQQTEEARQESAREEEMITEEVTGVEEDKTEEVGKESTPEEEKITEEVREESTVKEEQTEEARKEPKQEEENISEEVTGVVEDKTEEVRKESAREEEKITEEVREDWTVEVEQTEETRKEQALEEEKKALEVEKIVVKETEEEAHAEDALFSTQQMIVPTAGDDANQQTDDGGHHEQSKPILSTVHADAREEVLVNVSTESDQLPSDDAVPNSASNTIQESEAREEAIKSPSVPVLRYVERLVAELLSKALDHMVPVQLVSDQRVQIVMNEAMKIAMATQVQVRLEEATEHEDKLVELVDEYAEANDAQAEGDDVRQGNLTEEIIAASPDQTESTQQLLSLTALSETTEANDDHDLHANFSSQISDGAELVEGIGEAPSTLANEFDGSSDFHTEGMPRSPTEDHAVGVSASPETNVVEGVAGDWSSFSELFTTNRSFLESVAAQELEEAAVDDHEQHGHVDLNLLTSWTHHDHDEIMGDNDFDMTTPRLPTPPSSSGKFFLQKSQRFEALSPPTADAAPPAPAGGEEQRHGTPVTVEPVEEVLNRRFPAAPPQPLDQSKDIFEHYRTIFRKTDEKMDGKESKSTSKRIRRQKPPTPEEAPSLHPPDEKNEETKKTKRGAKMNAKERMEKAKKRALRKLMAASEAGKWTVMDSYDTYKQAEHAIELFEKTFPAIQDPAQNFLCLGKNVSPDTRSPTHDQFPAKEAPEHQVSFLERKDLDKKAVNMALGRELPRLRIVRDLSRMQWIVESSDPNIKSAYQTRITRRKLESYRTKKAVVSATISMDDGFKPTDPNAEPRFLRSTLPPTSLFTNHNSKNIQNNIIPALAKQPSALLVSSSTASMSKSHFSTKQRRNSWSIRLPPLSSAEMKANSSKSINAEQMGTDVINRSIGSLEMGMFTSPSLMQHNSQMKMPLGRHGAADPGIAAASGAGYHKGPRSFRVILESIAHQRSQSSK